MRLVANPPVLVPQQTGAWCFAACEVMVRAYRGLPALSQYAIARAQAAARGLVDPEFQERWEMAVVMDLGPPEQAENDGANRNSRVVGLVRTEWGAFDQQATGGRFVTPLTEQAVRDEIDADRILVIGNALHYLVVIGYEGAGANFTMHVLDPWPAGQGGQTQTVMLATYTGWQNRVAILF